MAKKKCMVDLIAGTVNEVGIDSFSVMTSDFHIYIVESSNKKLYSIRPMAGDVVWVYRAKAEHMILDILRYDENPEIESEPYEIEV